MKVLQVMLVILGCDIIDHIILISYDNKLTEMVLFRIVDTKKCGHVVMVLTSLCGCANNYECLLPSYIE